MKIGLVVLLQPGSISATAADVMLKGAANDRW